MYGGDVSKSNRILPNRSALTLPTAGAERHRRCFNIILLLILMTPLVGCSGIRQWYQNGFKVGPNYCPAVAPTAEHWIDAGNPQLSAARQVNACWWTTFADPTLNRLVAQAAEQNITLRIAGWRILQARAERGVASGNMLPQQQEMTGSYSRNSMSQNAFPFNLFAPVMPTFFYDNWSVGFDAAWELDFWGRFRRAVEAADANLDAQIAGYDEVLVMLQAEVAASYIQMRAFEQRIDLARKNVDLQKQTIQIINARYRSGLVTELDLQQAIYNLGITESLIPRLVTGRRLMQNRLAILLGMPPQQLEGCLPADGAIPRAPREVVVGIPADLLRRRPDVRQAERLAAAQSARIGIAQAEFYPHLAITGAIGVQAQNANQLIEPDSLVSSIGPGFRWNLLNYGRIANNVSAQDAQFQQALWNYCETVLKANEEAENAIVAFLQEQQRIESLAKSAQAAQRSVELALLQYEKGLISYQPLLDSQRVLVLQQDAVTESRGLVSVDLVAIYRAMAGGWMARLTNNAVQPLPPTSPAPKEPAKPAEPIPLPPVEPTPAPTAPSLAPTAPLPQTPKPKK
jgi:NodT family efflux transporter outer membrane factor (OMF) lipoprotein